MYEEWARPVHPRAELRGALLPHVPPLSLPAGAGAGVMNGTDAARGALAAQSSLPPAGVEGGRRRWPLRLLGPDRHRTGGSERAHVRRDLCVVFGGGCASVTWTQECACVCVRRVHYRMEWCVRAGHADLGVRLFREWCVCVCVLRVEGCIGKALSQVTGPCRGGHIWSSISARESGGAHSLCPGGRTGRPHSPHAFLQR